MPYKDPEKQKEYQREWLRKKLSDKKAQEDNRRTKARWRKNNRSKIREYDRQWRKTPAGKKVSKKHRDKRVQEKRDWLAETKTNLSCRICGENHPAALDFHHREPGTKESSIARMVTGPFTLDQLKAEVEKCEVLCANCHRIFHWEQKHEQ